MPPVGDDPVARRRRAAAAATSSAAAFATSTRAPSSPRWRRRPAAAAPPRRPPIALIFRCRGLALTPCLAAPAPRRPQHHSIVRPDRPSSSVRPWGGLLGGFRISLKRRSDGGQQPQRRPVGPSRSRCRPRSCRRGPRAREAMDKEEERAKPKPLVFQCRLLAKTPWLAGAARPQQQHHIIVRRERVARLTALERGHEPPRHVNASAAAMPPAPDTKADARRGSSGPELAREMLGIPATQLPSR